MPETTNPPILIAMAKAAYGERWGIHISMQQVAPWDNLSQREREREISIMLAALEPLMGREVDSNSFEAERQLAEADKAIVNMAGHIYANQGPAHLSEAVCEAIERHRARQEARDAAGAEQERKK